MGLECTITQFVNEHSTIQPNWPDQNLAKWLSVRLRTKWCWIKVPLQSPFSQLSGLTKKYIWEHLSVDSWEVATAQKLKKWKHLSCVASEAVKDDWNINDELLIGANYTRALEPTKVIASINDGPYAKKTVLGYCIVEPLSCGNQLEGKISWNWTVVIEPVSSKVGRHYFSVENKGILDDEKKSILKKIYEQEFTKPNMRFISVIGETTRDMSYYDQEF